ncbi:hypothetical protein PAERUG_P6_East_of_England_6_IMP_1_03_09_02702 [Pseudomonas aeruginosa]|nr:hypothetical protein PAERUG_P6_East_of_England_6_IMP_1_03_09_02702 [Pseudomonas aeruginosa]
MRATARSCRNSCSTRWRPPSSGAPRCSSATCRKPRESARRACAWGLRQAPAAHTERTSSSSSQPRSSRLSTARRSRRMACQSSATPPTAPPRQARRKRSLPGSSPAAEASTTLCAPPANGAPSSPETQTASPPPAPARPAAAARPIASRHPRRRAGRVRSRCPQSFRFQLFRCTRRAISRSLAVSMSKASSSCAGSGRYGSSAWYTYIGRSTTMSGRRIAIPVHS